MDGEGMSEQEHKYVYGLAHCPKEYDTLRVRVLVHQCYDTRPTMIRSELWADDYKFLAPTKSVCDVNATTAGLRELKCTANRLKYGTIARPKKVVIEIHNPMLFLVFTKQIDILPASMRNLVASIRMLYLQGDTELEIRLVDLSEMAYHPWTGNVFDWRDKKYVHADLTPIESQELLKRLYKKARAKKIEALNDR